MATNYQSSKETTNFARICRVVFKVIPELLRDLLNTRLPASGLPAVLTTQKRKIFSVLKQHQKNILYPQGGVYQGFVKDLDTSLLYILLRNIGNIPPHQNGWGKVPGIADRSLSANIDRLREQRNEAAHAPNGSLSDGEFQARWDIIRQSVEEIQNSELNTGRFVVAVDDILTMEMDHRMTNKYIEDFLLDIKGDMAGMSVKLDTMETDMADLQGNVGAVLDDVSDIRDDVGAVRDDVVAVRDDVSAVRDDVGAVRDDVGAVKEHLTVISADRGNKPRRAAIETTKSTVRGQTSRSEIISTQALEDAKEVIRKNGMVIIKGASGDGKTMMCYQLLKWLMDGDNKDTGLSKDPLQLYSMSKWDDIVQPEAQIALFIDDVSAEIVEELKSRKDSIQSAFCGKLKRRSNCLILNVRDEIFKSTQMSSCELFNDDNAIDLRGKNIMTSAEKLQILEMYVPKIKDLSGGKESEIVKLAPKIGFPQCCRLYRDVPILRNEGVDFFKSPVYFMEKTLKKLPKECSASLLFLFLNDGRVKKGDLDPNSENVDKKMLEIAFHGVELSHEDKIRSLRRSLDEILRSLVAKTKNCFLYDGDDVLDDDVDDDDVFYKFCHDSVQDTVALLYGNDTKIGFIENCPRKFLRYISTSKTIPNRIVISSSNKHMYKRLVREFESDTNKYCFFREYITALDVWTDIQFLQGFIRWLRGQNVDKNLCHEIKLALLNKACSSGSEECALFLLSEGVKPDKKTPFCVVEGGSKKVLEKIVEYLNDEIKLCLLNKACFSGSEECALFLLSEGVKPDRETPFCVVKRGSVNVLRKLLEYDVTQTARVHRSQSSYYAYNINVLHEACLFEREEMVTMLYDTYPHLIHDNVDWRRSTLHLVAQTGNCDIFKTVERIILKSLYRVEDEQHKCETVEGRVVHKSCVCAQYMCQLVDDNGSTVLHVSCRWGHREVCKYLCDSYPALTTAVDMWGETVLHVSCMEGHMEVCKYLCESYRALTTAVDNDGWTVLHVSCMEGHMEVCKYLCESYPALTTAVNNDRRTVLHVSCRFGHMEICKYLCESYPALSTAVDTVGRTVLHVSCEWGHMEFCKYLCETYPALTTAVNNDGRTVLHGSCERGRMEVCKYLCESYPALTTAVDKYGWHCLHYIARYTSDVDMFTECETHVKQFLESTGCKYDITTILTNQGESVLDSAKFRAKYRGTENNPLFDHLVRLLAQMVQRAK
ncbi:uncharacterized protein LOC110464446 [Mizuhopecten yessoensis]|uniref:uncharacterized protein LOC110464446 n=1 Tax=Mizuhopecten yessoensis TaxID=6573 RepID=UPI000B45B486|nr:uncharacterized protein LOC110464446 [Mizuhopecten yessoensis]